MTDRDTAAWRTFREVHTRLTKALDAELRTETELHLTWFDALERLAEAGGSLRMHELAERMLLSRSAATRFADRLERAGLVRRRECDRDRRGTRIMLTADGRDVLGRAAPIHHQGVETHFARYLSDDEAATLTRLLGKILVGEASLGDQALG